MSESVREHEQQAAEHARRRPIWCAVLTVSDTRSIDDDISGQRIVTYLEQAGHLCVKRTIVRDEPPLIESELRSRLAEPDIHAILITGGTGIGARDGTIEIVRKLLTHELEGFGELFRMLSWEQVGAAAMLSRAVGGLVAPPTSSDGATRHGGQAARPAAAGKLRDEGKDGASPAPPRPTTSQAHGTFVFAMPGSPNAVMLAMQKLIIPQLPHLVWQRVRE